MLQASVLCTLDADRTYVPNVETGARARRNGCENDRRARATRTGNKHMQMRRARARNTTGVVGKAHKFDCCSVGARLVLGCCSVGARLLFGCCSVAARLLLGCCSAVARPLFGCCLAAARRLLDNVEWKRGGERWRGCGGEPVWRRGGSGGAAFAEEAVLRACRRGGRGRSAMEEDGVVLRFPNFGRTVVGVIYLS